jgi:hypothetical protein
MLQAIVPPDGSSLRGFDAAFTSDGQHLVVSYTAEPFTGTTRSALVTYSVASWAVEARRDLPSRARELFLIGSSGDGSTMVAVSGYLAATDRTLYWLNPLTLADTRAPLARIHAAAIQGAAMSPDGTLIATGATDGSVRVWNMNGQRVNEMEFPGKGVLGLAFVSQTHIAVVLEDGNLRVETIDTPELLRVARSSLTRGFTTDECDQFHFDPCPTLDEMRTGSTTDR